MALLLSSPQYSFVQIAEPERAAGCVDEFNLCLPVLNPFDLNFQLIARVTGDEKAWFEVEFDVEEETHKYTVWGKICVDCAPIEGDEPDLPNAFAFTGNWTRVEEGEGDDPDVWIGNFIFNTNLGRFSDLASGACFNLCFHKVEVTVGDDITVDALTEEPIACTETCFQKIDDPCFTSKFQYHCKENSFGFTYTDPIGAVNFTNAIRLPCFLRDMQLPSEEKSYRKSDGTRIKLYARIDEEYELKVDWIYKEWHKRLKVLLEHDVITIDNTNDGPTTSMGIVCDEKYEIAWPEEPYQLATAKTKVKRSTAVHLTNSNCR